MIRFIKGDATQPLGNDPKIIVHICNNIGAWGAGFVLALSKRWKSPEKQYRIWHLNKRTPDGIPFELGQVQLVEVEDNLYVANLIGQENLYSSKTQPPIRYTAVFLGLLTLGDIAKEMGASIHMPRIGCGLAGGKWEKIEPIIKSTLDSRKISVTVYDFG